MNASEGPWELLIIDAAPRARSLGSLGVGDIDGDGQAEVVVGGAGALLWYRPATGEKGIAAEGDFHVGLALGDVDGDGRLEAVAGNTEPLTAIFWFKPVGDLHEPWERHVLDPDFPGSAHDLLFADIDGDGEDELLAGSVRRNLGIYVYKRTANPTEPWTKYTLTTGLDAEGLAVGDVDGDGQVEVFLGSNWYHSPPEGPLAGPWERRHYAHRFREMCRVALVDITGNGRPDVFICESEFPDGVASWFENRILEDPENPWVEHPMDRGLVFAHSLQAWREPDTGTVRVFLAEMMEGGWKSPRNRDARLIEYVTTDGGRTWNREVLYEGAGTHEATVFDVDGDGRPEIVGKEWLRPKVTIWKQRKEPSPLLRFRHRFLDRDKPETATAILATDVDGDGLADVVCGSWWYRNPGWERYDIPGVCQVINAFDIDGDGRDELIATKRSSPAETGYGALTSDLCWLKPVDPVNGKWEEYLIGSGTGDWPHGLTVAPVLPGGRLALIVGYHSAAKGHFPEIFEVPDDPREGPWPKRVLAEIPYGEELVVCDVNGNGTLDIVAGTHWLENLGDGTFCPHTIAEGFDAARVCVTDVNGNGRPDIVVGEEVLDFENQMTPLSRLAWFESPEEPRRGPWTMHVIDTVRCPHSLGVADLDGDGEPEIVCGEHDPFRPYRSRCRLLVYKKADPEGRTWFRYILDERFEHHDGTKIFEVAPGRLGILSHGWKDRRYVHLWEAYR